MIYCDLTQGSVNGYISVSGVEKSDKWYDVAIISVGNINYSLSGGYIKSNQCELVVNKEYLSKINYKFIIAINKILGITTKIRWSSEFDLVDGQTEKLLGICKDCNADVYISGPAAKDYFDEDLAKKRI